MTYDNANCLAMLYDWHNRLRLQGQLADIKFWTDMTGSPCHVAIMGAGTGRIAVSLVHCGHQVTAVDLDLARLKRIPSIAGLDVVCADYCEVSLAPIFCHVIFPYSALQLVPIACAAAALRAASSAVSTDGTIWVDVSDSFENRPPHDWRCVLEAHCLELGVHVQEWQRGERFEDHLELGIRFEAGGKVIAQTVERWHYHKHEAFFAAVTNVGLVIREKHLNYSAGAEARRHIYRMARRY